MYRLAWLRAIVKKTFRRFFVVIEFHWPTLGESHRYRVRPMREDEVVILIWSFYGSKLSSDQIKSVLGKMLGTGQADEKTIQKAVDHCEGVVNRMDNKWGPLVSTLIQ